MTILARSTRFNTLCAVIIVFVFARVTDAADAPKIRGEIIIDRADGAWESQQVQEPCILPNPKDPTRLIMFYSGVPKSDRNVCAVGKAWATVADPFTWHQDSANPIFVPNPSGWDSKTLRLDAVLYIAEEDAYYIYYSGSSGNIQDRIGLAISPAGDDGYSKVTQETTKRVGTAPVLAPEAASPYFENMASQAAVWRERDPATASWKWYLYYSYRGKDGTLPGIRLATSSNGRDWSRQFNEADPRGMGQIFVSTPEAYYEWHQVQKIGRTYLLSIEVGTEHGKRWRPVFAVSHKPDTGWIQLDVDTVLQTKWEGLYRDDALFHVATPALYQIGGQWLLYAQACPLPANKNYIDGQWDIWCVAADREIETLPGYDRVFIPGPPTAPR
ncbi:MAG: hypothetical protein ABIV50_03600 [Opitutus sp.]